MTSLVMLVAGLTTSLCLAAPLCADLIQVDAAGGADFTDLPAAVAAAQEGDVLLIAPGVYSGVSIDGVSMQLVADGVGVSIAGHVRILNLEQGQRVGLAGLEIAPPFPTFFDAFSMSLIPPALSVLHCLGAVRIERSTILAATLQPGDGGCSSDFGFWPAGRDALVVRSSADVVLESVLAEGGFGWDGAGQFLCLEQGSDGGRAVVVQDSHVDLHEVIARGADGADQGYAGFGGNGVDVSGSSDVLLSGVIASGGNGGDSYDFIGGPPLGNGGDGVRTELGTFVRFVGGVYSGGVKGNACCWTNFDGQGKVVDGAETTYAGGPHRFLTDSPAREGELLELSITGAAGDSAFLIVGLDTLNVPKPGFAGAIYVATPFLLGPVGLAPMGNGITTYNLPVPELGPSLDVFTLEMQLFVLESGGAKHLTGPAQVVLLDGGV
ncbi:MAG: hypothetical protein DHS20C15_04280 [Planctomycetota bacterium]|nr:MAG: hypothetical protein DHS20C15_04280 [Planctomycetota bacterium]